MTSVAVVAHNGKMLGDGLGRLREALAEHGVTDPLWYEVPKSRKAPKRVREALDVSTARTVIGLAGTVTALSAMQLGLAQYDAKRTHHSRLSAASVATLGARLARANVVERRGMLVEPARAEVIIGGAIVLATTMSELGLTELLVSEHDILDGLAASLR